MRVASCKSRVASCELGDEGSNLGGEGWTQNKLTRINPESLLRPIWMDRSLGRSSHSTAFQSYFIQWDFKPETTCTEEGRAKRLATRMLWKQSYASQS